MKLLTVHNDANTGRYFIGGYVDENTFDLINTYAVSKLCSRSVIIREALDLYIRHTQLDMNVLAKVLADRMYFLWKANHKTQQQYDDVEFSTFQEVLTEELEQRRVPAHVINRTLEVTDGYWEKDKQSNIKQSEKRQNPEKRR